METKLTQVLAIWGAVVSTVAIIWNVVKDLRDKGQLKVVASVNSITISGSTRNYLGITITNKGRRPISLKGWGGKGWKE